MYLRPFTFFTRGMVNTRRPSSSLAVMLWGSESRGRFTSRLKTPFLRF